MSKLKSFLNPIFSVSTEMRLSEHIAKKSRNREFHKRNWLSLQKKRSSDSESVMKNDLELIKDLCGGSDDVEIVALRYWLMSNIILKMMLVV